MMRKTIIVLLCLVLSAALFGCECKHEWTEADCVNASVCSRCQETGEAALGHTFAAAACEVPETCTRCGETRGEALGHSFGEWTYGDTQQVRTCETCGAEEREEIDREARMFQLLSGRWEYYGATMEDKEITPIQWPFFSYAQIEESGTFRYVTGLVSQDMTVEYTDYDPEKNCYYAKVITPSGDPSPMILEIRETGSILRTNAGGEMEIHYCKYEQTRDLLVGTWAGIYNGNTCYVTLNPDGTFAGDIGGEFTGEWIKMPGREDGANANDGCMLGFEVDGKIETLYGERLVFASTNGLEKAGEDVSLRMYSRNSRDAMDLRKMDQEGVNALKAAQAEASEVILGSWKSKNVYVFDGTHHTPHILLDQELTVREDGTFTASLDKVIEGTWTFQTVSISEKGTTYSYRFEYPDAPRDLPTVTYSTWSRELNFLYNDGTYSHYVGFANLTEEQRADFLRGPELLPGEYVSEKITSIDSETGEEIETAETGYTITISEDGTYTAQLDEPITDQWFFSDLSPEGGHTYAFRVKGSQYESRLTEDGRLIFMYRINGKFCYIHFRQK